MSMGGFTLHINWYNKNPKKKKNLKILVIELKQLVGKCLNNLAMDW